MDKNLYNTTYQMYNYAGLIDPLTIHRIELFFTSKEQVT